MDQELSARLGPDRLDTRWLGRALRLYDDVPSTSSVLAEWAASGAPHGATVVAARQSAGRGRQGRSWESPVGNLYVSWLVRPRRPVAEMAPLSLVVGLAVAAVLREATGSDDPGLKWPNDVWIGLRKVGGVLLESRIHPSPSIVVGLGLNLLTPPHGWERELRGRVIALDECAVAWTPAQALLRLLPRLEADHDRFENEGLSAFASSLREYSLLDGRRVHIERAGRHQEVEVIAIDASGGLRVRSDDGIERIVHAGEVHLGEIRA